MNTVTQLQQPTPSYKRNSPSENIKNLPQIPPSPLLAVRKDWGLSFIIILTIIFALITISLTYYTWLMINLLTVGLNSNYAGIAFLALLLALPTVILFIGVWTFLLIIIIKNFIILAKFPKNRIELNNTKITLYITKKITNTIEVCDVIYVNNKFSTIYIKTIKNTFKLKAIKCPHIVSDILKDRLKYNAIQ